MQRQIRLVEKLLLLGLSLILIFMIVQDLVPLGSLNDLDAISQDRSFNEILIVTLVGVVQILLLLGMVLIFMGKRYPIWIRLWLVIHQLFIFAGALIDWWIPYFFGYGAEQRVERYEKMFGDTHSFLPVIHGIVPNTLHVMFHTLLLSCIILSIYISLTNRRNNSSGQLKAS
ncbi:hypothetical protein SAMN04487943_11939 [Gracilibacillus orientalis]|uniref:Uncharacterized protein n=1 Tax=Gracilibacillus orientalis TaxID=334253 RepID=A0A1I4QZP7_9BACI|nr:hypothetical protein [Gracilibacillus orientalis]SFM45554.1 hypothetical protein SAMN04487943_11939 [Gracilibacillus orientalis]